VHAVDGH
jgi:hypothetical protein